MLNTQQYKVRIKGKVEQSKERSSALPLHLGVVAIKKGAFWSPSTTVANLTLFILEMNNPQYPMKIKMRLLEVETLKIIYIFTYVYIGWLVGLILWHINPCKFFQAKSCLCTYVLDIYNS